MEVPEADTPYGLLEFDLDNQCPYGWLTINPGSDGRILMHYLNCNLDLIQSLFDTEILNPNEFGHNVNTNDFNMINLLLLRNKYPEVIFKNYTKNTPSTSCGIPILPVTQDQIKDMIRLVVKNGVNINRADTKARRYDISSYDIISIGTPLEFAIFIDDFEMARFLKELGANDSRPIPVLEPQLRKWETYKKGQRNLSTLRVTLGNRKPIPTGANWYYGSKEPSKLPILPTNVTSRIGTFLTGLSGTEAQQASTIKNKIRKARKTRKGRK